MEIRTLGIDLAKSVFQLHGVDEDGTIVLQKKVRRSALLDVLGRLEPCLIGMEACPTSHFWAREIAALGHDVRLIPPAYVKPYVKRQKNDAADAEAICEAVTRPNMRFVPMKTEEQQAVLVLHRSRDLLMRQRTMILNAIRAQLAEFGVVAAQGPRRVTELVRRLSDPDDIELPSFARDALLSLGAQLESLAVEIARIERRLMAWHRKNRASQRLETIPGGRHHHRHCACRQRTGSDRLPVRSPVRGLAGARAAAELVWWQGAIGARVQDGEWLPAATVGRRRDLGDAAC